MLNIVNNNLIFGDFNLGNLGKVEKVIRPALPPIEIESKNIIGKDGEVYKGKIYGSIEIEVYVRLFSFSNIDKVINEFVSYLDSRDLKSLNYRGKRTWYDATLTDCELVEKYRQNYSLLKLVFFVPSGLARGQFMREEYKDFTEKKISLAGNCPVKPIFLFKGSSVKIINSRTGEFISIEEGSIQDFIIDHEKSYVYQDDINLMKRLKWNSDFFEIKDGDIIKSDKPISLKFYDRYLYDV